MMQDRCRGVMIVSHGSGAGRGAIINEGGASV